MVRGSKRVRQPLVLTMAASTLVRMRTLTVLSVAVKVDKTVRKPIPHLKRCTKAPQSHNLQRHQLDRDATFEPVSDAHTATAAPNNRLDFTCALHLDRLCGHRSQALNLELRSRRHGAVSSYPL